MPDLTTTLVALALSVCLALGIAHKASQTVATLMHPVAASLATAADDAPAGEDAE